MTLKKLLIIQQDDPYFLFETLAVLEKYHTAFRGFETTVLVSAGALRDVSGSHAPLVPGLTTDEALVRGREFDLSVNLSLSEPSWDLHAEIRAKLKLGPCRKEGQLLVPDLWSSYLLTLKARAPFLTFHLQDIYRNILGIRGLPKMAVERHSSVRQIAFGFCASALFPADEQELLVQDLSTLYPQLQIKEISEVDLVSDLSHTLYLGPASLGALKFAQAGGKGIFLGSHFQGLNMLPCSEGHLYVSSKGRALRAADVLSIVRNEISSPGTPVASPYSIYRIENDQASGAYVRSLNSSDDHYPFYQTHVVLWNFLLNLVEVNTEITKCTAGQVQLLRSNHEVLAKVIRLQDYAMASIDAVYQESRAAVANQETIDGHLNNLTEIDRLTDQIAGAFPLLRPVLDFYRIRRGQNDGTTLHDQSQKSFLTYSEEHQALKALDELFTVTLRKNEATI